jgi:hypothetical protein
VHHGLTKSNPPRDGREREDRLHPRAPFGLTGAPVIVSDRGRLNHGNRGHRRRHDACADQRDRRTGGEADEMKPRPPMPFGGTPDALDFIVECLRSRCACFPDL